MSRRLRWRAGALAALAALASGCATAPFAPLPPLPAGAADPAGIPARFAARVPRRFEQANAVLFRIGPKAIAALGCVSADADARTFAVACFAPVGPKLFEVAGTGDVAAVRFLQPGFPRPEAFVRAVADDIRRTYLDPAPPPGTPVRLDGRAAVFAVETPEGRMEYRFAGPDGVLASKTLRRGGRRVWSASYHDYAPGRDGLVARGVVVRNHRYRYTLVVRSAASPP